MTNSNPAYQKKFGNPPDYFFLIYDSRIQGVPVEEIRKQPLVFRFQYRTVVEIMKEVNMTLAKGSMPVYDYSKYY